MRITKFLELYARKMISGCSLVSRRMFSLFQRDLFSRNWSGKSSLAYLSKFKLHPHCIYALGLSLASRLESSQSPPVKGQANCPKCIYNSGWGWTAKNRLTSGTSTRQGSARTHLGIAANTDIHVNFVRRKTTVGVCFLPAFSLFF